MEELRAFVAQSGRAGPSGGARATPASSSRSSSPAVPLAKDPVPASSPSHAPHTLVPGTPPAAAQSTLRRRSSSPSSSLPSRVSATQFAATGMEDYVDHGSSTSGGAPGQADGPGGGNPGGQMDVDKDRNAMDFEFSGPTQQTQLQTQRSRYDPAAFPRDEPSLDVSRLLSDTSLDDDVGVNPVRVLEWSSSLRTTFLFAAPPQNRATAGASGVAHAGEKHGRSSQELAVLDAPSAQRQRVEDDDDESVPDFPPSGQVPRSSSPAGSSHSTGAPGKTVSSKGASSKRKVSSFATKIGLGPTNQAGSKRK
ncbi:hypothetical protein FRC07_002883 [Ceratobasidium sp. 392]|nr:hypothetical protein FRC07_002883 [Ceratobasidium sp. 392]